MASMPVLPVQGDPLMRKKRDCWVYVRQYCAKIDEAARNRMELIVRSLAEQNGVTEKLKADTKWNGYGR